MKGLLERFGLRSRSRDAEQSTSRRSLGLRLDSGGRPASLDEQARSVEVVAATETDEGERAFRKVREGHLTDFSASYRVFSYRKLAENETAGLGCRTWSGLKLLAVEVAAREDHEADATAHGSMPTGGIIMWSGAIDAVPQGWALCDGQNGTPDLRGRFIVGAGGSYAVCSTGGSLVTQVKTLTTAQMPSHGHTCAASAQDHEGSGSFGGNSTGRAFNLGTDASGSGQGHSHDYAPPYYALCFIMKL
ncbi:Tail Collar domain-containing protein [Desulfocurvibacter africanus]|uniref:Tail Collar domain protein n=1 Tax=Desulfocurvibacter africanus subsp. africanus str. Walvis Bay TaxID=690850 RepID=F3YZ90_DESAF|nr:Tail Collar domain-containing protein [Desulfocurvibacter africanus]EGJ50846.1 Tail Collar domain protein [Desulfocurvibacter africanus subsp. africanus str. Walvis Bay]